MTESADARQLLQKSVLEIRRLRAELEELTGKPVLLAIGDG